MIARLRMLGFIEAVSLLILVGIAMPLKYLAGQPEAVRVAGAVHGGLFLLYAGLAWIVANENNWSYKKLIFALAAASLPLGPFIFDKKLFPELAQTDPARL